MAGAIGYILLLTGAATSIVFLIPKMIEIVRLHASTRIGSAGAAQPVPIPSHVKRIPLELFMSGVYDLEREMGRYRPQTVIGVHPGGRLLSTYVANRLANQNIKCLFARTHDDSVFVVSNEPLAGRILLIDDITRTGGTIRALQRYMVDQCQEDGSLIDEFTFAVLLSVERPINFRRQRIADDTNVWHKFTTKNEGIQLPWSILSERIKSDLVFKRRGYDFSSDLLAVHELIVKDRTAALECAKLAIEQHERFEGYVKEGKLLPYLTEVMAATSPT